MKEIECPTCHMTSDGVFCPHCGKQIRPTEEIVVDELFNAVQKYQSEDGGYLSGLLDVDQVHEIVNRILAACHSRDPPWDGRSRGLIEAIAFGAHIDIPLAWKSFVIEMVWHHADEFRTTPKYKYHRNRRQEKLWFNPSGWRFWVLFVALSVPIPLIGLLVLGW